MEAKIADWAKGGCLDVLREQRGVVWIFLEAKGGCFGCVLGPS